MEKRFGRNSLEDRNQIRAALEKTLGIHAPVNFSWTLDFTRLLQNANRRTYKIGHYRYLLLDNSSISIFHSVGDRWEATSIVSIGSTRSIDGVSEKVQAIE